jgi:hypothetical protein
VYEDGKERHWTGTYGRGQDPLRDVAPVKKKKKKEEAERSSYIFFSGGL